MWRRERAWALPPPPTQHQQHSAVRLGAPPHPRVCAREKVRDRGGRKVKKGERPSGSPSVCAGRVPSGRSGAPGWLPPTADGEPGSRCSEQSTHGSRKQWPASQAWRFLLTETQASICKVSHWHMPQTGWQVDFEHRLGEEEQAATRMSRGCAQKWLLCSASLCSHGAAFV